MKKQTVFTALSWSIDPSGPWVSKSFENGDDTNDDIVSTWSNANWPRILARVKSSKTENKEYRTISIRKKNIYPTDLLLKSINVQQSVQYFLRVSLEIYTPELWQWKISNFWFIETEKKSYITYNIHLRYTLIHHQLQ